MKTFSFLTAVVILAGMSFIPILSEKTKSAKASCWQYAGQIDGFEARATGTGVTWDKSKFTSPTVFIEYSGPGNCIAGISVPNSGTAHIGWWCGTSGTYSFYISADCKVLQGVHVRP